MKILRIFIADILASLALGIGVAALAGHATQIEYLASWGGKPPISLPASVAIILLSVERLVHKV